MPSRHALSERLDELQRQLGDSASLSPADRARLERLVADARRHAEGEAEDEPHSLAEHLLETKEHFEESHPNLTFAIGAVAEALSRLGI